MTPTWLSEVAEERPLIRLVDDEQWLDRASAQPPGLPELACRACWVRVCPGVPSGEAPQVSRR